MTRIIIKLAGLEGVSYERWPVTFGIPFADGALEHGAPVRLCDAAGVALPIQTQCLATWHPDRRFVKWLLIDTQVDATGGAEPELYLEYPVKGSPPAPTPAVMVSEDDGLVRVDTGALRLDLRPARAHEARVPNSNPFERLAVRAADGWRDLLCDTAPPYLYIKDQHGRTYDSCRAGPPPQVTIEERGPLRASVRIDGHHAMERGPRMCPYTLRIHLFAGLADLRVFHTFVFDQEPDDVELSAVGMVWPLEFGSSPRTALGGEQQVYTSDRGDALQIVQRDDRHYDATRDDRVLGEGGKAGGGASLNGDRAGAIAAVRYWWQEYPKGLAVDRDSIDVQVWPQSHAHHMAFTTPYKEHAILFGASKANPSRDEDEIRRLIAERPTAPLNLKSLNPGNLKEAAWVEAVLEKHAQGRVMSYNDTGVDDGAGAAKTTEVHLRLSPTGVTDEQARALAACVREPLVAVADPSHVCSTGALGHFYPRGDPRFAQIDKDIDDVFDRVVVEPVEPCRLYGMWRYGNLVCAHSNPTGWVYLLYRERDPSKALRYVGPFHNEAADLIMAAWHQFARTGLRDHLLIAERYARCVADVGFIHAHPSHPEHVGLMHYHSAHQWSGGPSPSHSIVSGILTDYYFTGNRRLLDVATEAADHVIDTQEPSGIVSCRNGYMYREFAGPMSILMDVYQATWEQRYADTASRSLNWLLRTVPAPGRFPYTILTRGDRGDEAFVQPPGWPEACYGNNFQIYDAALRLFASEPLRELILTEAEYWAWQAPMDTLAYQCTTVCYGYAMTGDVNFAAYAWHIVSTNFHDVAEEIRNREMMDFQGIWFSGYIPPLLRIVADAMTKDPDGFAAAADRWRERRRTMPDRERVPSPLSVEPVSAGVVSTAPLPDATHRV